MAILAPRRVYGTPYMPIQGAVGALSMWYGACRGYTTSATVLTLVGSVGTPQPSPVTKPPWGYNQELWSMGSKRGPRMPEND